MRESIVVHIWYRLGGGGRITHTYNYIFDTFSAIPRPPPLIQDTSALRHTRK